MTPDAAAPAPAPAPAAAPSAAPAARWLTRLYWLALAASVLTLVLPLWVAGVAPVVDFGGHLQMVDAWTVLPDDPFYAAFLERRDSWLAPNLLAARFVELLHPRVDADAALRLFVTLTVVLQAAGLVYLCRVFERSRWLVFLALPFVWGGMMALGLVNYVLAIGLLLFALGLARRIGLAGATPARLAALGALGLAAFWAHGMGFVFLAAFALGVLALSARRLRDAAAGALVLVPSSLLWLRWFLEARTDTAGRGTALIDALDDEAGLSLGEKLARLLRDAMDVSRADTDDILFWALVGAWIVLMATAAATGNLHVTESPAPAPAAAPAGSRARAALRALRRGALRLRAELREHTLLLVTCAFALGVFVLPTYVDGVALGPRLITPLCLCTMLLPRVGPASPLLARAALAAVVALPAVFGLHLTRQALRFDAAELAPLRTLAAAIPPEQRVHCAGVIGAQEHFRHRLLRHGCNGYLAHARRAYAGGGFAGTGFNAVRWRDPSWSNRLHDLRWQGWLELHRWDYVVVRGDHATPPDTLAGEVLRLPAEPRARRAEWTLYRVQQAVQRPVDAVLEAGGAGGSPITWSRPPGMLLGGLTVAAAGDGEAVSALTPRCRSLHISREDLVTGADRVVNGPRFGGDAYRGTRVLTCAAGKVPVGVFGRHDRFVTRLGLICGYPDLPGEGDSSAWYDVDVAERTRAVGQDERSVEGAPFALRCPVGTVVSGVRGRAGVLIDAAGIACTRIDTVLAEQLAAAHAAEEGAPDSL